MPRPTVKSIATLLGVFLLIWLSIRYLLPIALPFLLGVTLSLAAEPVVQFLQKRLPRSVASGIGVSLTLVFLSCIIVMLTSLLVRELSLLAGALPDLEETAVEGLSSLEVFLLDLTARTPDGIRPLLSGAVTELFSDGTAVVDRLVQRLPGMASSVLGHIPGSALTVGTGILSAFMLSVRLPKIRQWLHLHPVSVWLGQYLPALSSIRAALGGWIKAQLKLSALSFLIVLTGMLLLGIAYAPMWAFFTALVDAVPILGTGAVLIPWSLVSFLQGNHILAIGLLGTYAVAFLARTALEPRLVGKQLGIDPLMTLVALYAGYRIWGFAGMLLAPLLCVTATELIKKQA